MITGFAVGERIDRGARIHPYRLPYIGLPLLLPFAKSRWLFGAWHGLWL